MDTRTFLVPLVAGMIAIASVHAGAQAVGPESGFAVLELFTSEGCSSCPPADEVLSELSRAAQKEGLPVYALEWHVDYWDSLGWKDPFDSPGATERQYAYARALPSNVYTPQLIVNGTLVPSYAGNRWEIDRDMRSLIRAPSSGGLHLRLQSTGSDSSLQVQVELSGAPAGTQLILALTEAGLGASPTTGENAGRRLIHSSVVRSFVVLPAASTETRFEIPAGVDVARSRLVGILQDPRTMRIFAADQAAIPAHAAARLSGKVINTAGRAVAGATLQACSGTICVPAITNSSGIFVFERLSPGSWSLAFDPNRPAAHLALTAGQDLSLRQPLVLNH